MKKCLFAIILLLISMLSFQCYYIRQGVMLLDLYRTAEDIDAVLAKSGLSSGERDLLVLVKEVKRYASDTLGLALNKNYSTYIRINKDYLADIVSACDKYAFNQYRWKYLFVGELPYKGFFNKPDAEKEARALLDEGYDVYVRQVDAFSTLGILSDPIFSFMADYPAYALADLIFHEQAHATLFLRDQGTFNENFAEFVGETGMCIFIKEKYGSASKEYKIAVALDRDRRAFAEEIQGLYGELNAVYKRDISKEEKIKLKTDVIAAWKKNFHDNYQKHFATNLYQRFSEQEINNAVIMTFMNYSEKQNDMEELYTLAGNDLVRFIKLARGLKGDEKNPLEALRKIIVENNGTKN